MARKKHLINVHTSTGTTAPTGASLYLGEIAVQHTPNDPALWIKVGSSESSTQYEKFAGKTEITNMFNGYVSGVTMNGTTKTPVDGIVDLGTVVTGETQLSKGTTTGTGNVVTDLSVSNHQITLAKSFSAAPADQFVTLSGAAHNKITALSAGTIALVAASAASVFSSAKTYTDDEIGKLDSTGTTTDANHYLTSVTITNGKITAVGEAAVPAETDITTSSTGNGNVITNITATGHALTLTKGITAATSGQVSELSSATVAHINSAASHVSATDRTTWNGKQDAITDLATIRNNAQSGASAYTMVQNLSAVTLTGVTAGGTAVPVSNKVAAIPSASSDTFGVVKTGAFLANTNGTISVSTGTTSSTVARGDHTHSNYAAVTDLNALSAATTAHTADSASHVTSADKSKWNSAITAVTSAGTGNAFTDYSVADNKLTLTKGATYLTTAATTTQGARADSALQVVSGSTYITAGAKSGSAGAYSQTLTAKQQGVSSATATGQGLADAYDVKQYVDGLVTSSVDYKGATATLPATSTVGDLYITTAQIVLTAAQSATGAAQTAETGDFIIARSSGKWDVIQKNLDGAITGDLTANTVTLGNGTHTVKSLANGSNGQVLSISSNVPTWVNAALTDSATTKDGHYNPGLTATTTGTSAANGFIKSLALDGKGHITGVTTGTSTDEHVTAVGNHYTATTATKTGGTTTTSAASAIKGVTYDAAGHIVGITTGSVLTSFTETQLSTASTGTGNVIGNITVSNHQITSNMFSAASADQIAKLSAATTSHTENTTVHVTANDKTKWNSAITSVTQNGTSVVTNNVAQIVETSVSTTNGSTSNTAAAAITGITTGGTKGHALTLAKTNKIFSATTSDSANTVLSAVTSLSAQTTILGPTYSYSGIPYVFSSTSLADAYSALTKELIDDEKVTSAALNDLNDRVNILSANSSGDYVTTQEFESHELVAAAAFNDLNSRIIELSGSVADVGEAGILGSSYTYSGLPYVNSATTVADAYSALTNELFKDEKVTSAALNDLNDRVNSISAVTSNVVTADEYDADEEIIAEALNDLNDRIIDLSGDSSYHGSLIQVLSGLVADISGNTGGGGGADVAPLSAAVITLSAGSHNKITNLSGATTAHTANTTMHITSTERTRWQNAWTSGVSAYTRVNQLSAATVAHTASTISGRTSGQIHLPTVTTSDNGKVPVVRNGAWTLENTVSVYSGTGTPSSGLGNNGDIYIQTS